MTVAPGAGLRWTTALLAALVVLQIWIGALILMSRTGDIGRLGDGSMIRQIRAAADLIDASPPETRDAVLEALNSPLLRFRLAPSYSALESESQTPPRLSRWQAGAATARPFRMIAPATEDRETLRAALSAPRVAVALRLSDGGALVVEPSRFYRRRALLNGAALLSTALAIAIAAGLFLSARATVRPLRQMADQAERFAAQMDAPPMPESGPAAVASLARSFNRMRTMLARLVEERTRTLAAVAHDLRTYLTRLRMRAEFIPDEIERAKAVRDLEEMAQLIEDTLLVGRTAHAPPETERIDLGALAREVVTQRQDAGGAARLGEAPAGIFVEAKIRLLRRAIENLVDNALRYGGNAEVSVTTDGSQAELAVRDTGAGVPEAMLASLTEPFFRLETSRSRQTGGAGLGLAIVRAAAEESGGRLEFANIPSGGFRATIRLPLAEQAPQPSSITAS